MPSRHGAYPEDWARFDLVLGLTADLLPVVSNPSARVSEKSKLKALGKVPSKYDQQGNVIGILNWTSKQSTAPQVEQWSKTDDYGICLQTRNVRALDLDIEDEETLAAIGEVLQDLNLKLPIRLRENSNKCLLAFRVPGNLNKRSFKVKGGMIEFLASGQQFIAAGQHPSGARYEWDWQGLEDFPEFSIEDFEVIWKVLTDRFAIEPVALTNERKNDPALGNLIENDEIAKWLENNNRILSTGKDHQLYIECPFKSEHTGDSGETETAYFPAGSRGYSQGHFKCLHAHCAGREDTDFLNMSGFTASKFEVVLPEETTQTINDNPFKAILVKDFANRPPLVYHVAGVLPRGDLAVIFGESGAGKSFVALDIAMAITRGIEWNGHKTTKGRVVYICAEAAGGFAKRLKAYAIGRGTDLESLNMRVIAGAPDLLKEKDYVKVIEAVKADGPADIVIVDTFAQTTPGANENTSEDTGKALKHCRLIGQQTGATIVLIHHAGKDLTKGARGWSGLRAAADAEIEVSREGDFRAIKITKQKDGDDGESWGFRLNSVTVGLDDEGKSIDSCFIEITGAVVRKVKEKKRGFWQELVLSAWNHLGGGNCELNRIVDEAVRNAPFEDGNGEKDRRRERVLRAVRSLSQEKVFEIRDNHITINL